MQRRIQNVACLASLALLASVAACSSAPSAEPNADVPQQDRISNEDDPATLLPGVSTKLSDAIVAADVGKTFGTDDGHVPYPDTYWPFVDNGCDAQWAGEGTKSPLEKFMAILDPTHVDAAKKWERANHGKDVPGVQDWFGHCPGWTASSMLNAPLKHAAFAKSDGHGGVVACAEGSDGCVKFEIADVNALMAETYVDAASRFIGGRCDTKPSDVQRDQYGRIARNGGGCQGLNPGALMVVLGDQMKRQHKAMAIDAQNDFNTDQIWNQPAYRYHVYRYETLTEAQAANLVATGKREGTLTKYQWNATAHGFALVDVGVLWVSENGPNTEPVSGVDSTHETRMVAVIELDKAPTDATARIVGGEYLDDPTAGADRLTVPPFVWVATDIGPENPWGGGNGHNPYVKPSAVKKLIALAQQ